MQLLMLPTVMVAFHYIMLFCLFGNVLFMLFIFRFLFCYDVLVRDRDYRGSRESLNSGMTYNAAARRGSNASFYDGSFAFFYFALFIFCLYLCFY